MASINVHSSLAPWAIAALVLMGVDLSHAQVAGNVKTCDSAGGSSCSDAVPCFKSIEEAPGACRSINTAIRCLIEKSKTTTCCIQHKNMTLENVLGKLEDMCSVAPGGITSDENCDFINQCITTSPKLDLKNSQGKIVIKDIINRIVEPSFICQYLTVTASCYISEGTACGISSQVVSALEKKYKGLENYCSGSVHGSASGVLPLALTLGVVFLTLLLST